MNSRTLIAIGLKILLIWQLPGCGVKSAPVPERPLPAYEAKYLQTNQEQPENAKK